jgi:hypothetical protein
MRVAPVLMFALALACAGPLRAGDPMEQALEQARTTSSTALGLDAEALRITTYTDPRVPGLVVFHAHRPYDGGRVRQIGGAIVDGRTYVNGAEALGKVFEAWGYGSARTRPADEVARVAVLLVSSDEPSSVMTSESDFSYAKRSGFDDAAGPTDVDVDGRPGVRFWFSNGYNPFSEVEVVPAASPGAPATIRYGRTHGGG